MYVGGLSCYAYFNSAAIALFSARVSLQYRQRCSSQHPPNVRTALSRGSVTSCCIALIHAWQLVAPSGACKAPKTIEVESVSWALSSVSLVIQIYVPRISGSITARCIVLVHPWQLLASAGAWKSQKITEDGRC